MLWMLLNDAIDVMLLKFSIVDVDKPKSIDIWCTGWLQMV